MSLEDILCQLLEKLKAEQVKNKCYMQGYEDAISEAILILEKHKKQIAKSETKETSSHSIIRG